MRLLLAPVALAVLLAVPLPAAERPFDLLEVLPLTGQVVMVHIIEGHAVDHRLGQKRGEEHVELTPLAVAAACDPGSWTVACAADPAFAAGVHPLAVHRKSKGTAFAWMVQGWDQQAKRAVNHDPDHAEEHWLYLQLPQPMRAGCTYRIDGGAIPHVGSSELAWDPLRARSEAVHVNLIGYVPGCAKYAYVHHWGGDMGPLDLGAEPRRFHLVDQAGGRVAFSGPVAFRAAADHVETAQTGDTPHGNYLGAPVWECDFGAFAEPGTYVVAVDGVGCSYPFRIAADAYREAFRTTARGLYHNRSGIALTRPFTEYERPAPANPLLTPGFAGHLVYTTSPWTAWSNDDSAPADRAAVQAGIKGPLEVWGFYQDAGDWDGYWTHLNVATALLFAYEMAPRNFSDGELGIPESGNRVPDILDEAAWLPRFCHRLRHALLANGWGSGGIGLRVCGDFSGGDERADGTTRGSWQDDRQYIVSGEDRCSTMRYAGAAAHLATALRLAGVPDPEGVDWVAEARAAYAWAEASPDRSHGEEYLDQRMYAAATLFRATGEGAYEEQLDRDTAAWKVGDELWWTRPYGAWAYCLGGGAPPTRPQLVERLRRIVLRSCEIRALETTARRALRWGGGWAMPMVIGQQTTPWIMEGMVGDALCRATDPVAAKAYRDAVATTCDYFLGSNALNQTWVTGLGVRHVEDVFHLDAWYNGHDGPHPGIVPYGPSRCDPGPGMGPWDIRWPNTTLHPASLAEWPGNERWFGNRNCPLTAEFTIHQTTCWAAAVYGWMCAPR